MTSISVSVFVLFVIVNLLSVPLVSSCGECPPKPKPKPKPEPKPCSPPPTPIYSTCPIDALKLGVCGNLLNGVVNVVIGTPPKTPCCTLIQGLVDLEAAVCLCTAIKANVLGLVNLNLNVDLTLLLNYCGKKVPEGFICPS